MTHLISKVQRLYTLIYILLAVILAAVGFLALNGNRHWDLTRYQRHSLSSYSKDIVANIDQPTTIYAFIGHEPEHQQAISRALAPYLQKNDQIKLLFKDPETELTLIKKFGVQESGTLVISQSDRFSHIIGLTESAITKGFEAVQRVRPLTIGFAYGQGERRIDHDGNFHYAEFAKALKSAGLKPISINLSQAKTVPDNVDVLVLADPRIAYASFTRKAINQFLESGKNLFILGERKSAPFLEGLFNTLTLPLTSGVVTNNSAQAYDINDSSISVISPNSEQVKFPPLADLASVLLFSEATVLKPIAEYPKEANWAWYPILTHSKNTLLMRDGSATQLDDALVAVEASRLIKKKNIKQRQRVFVFADADFLSNQYIGNGANRDFGIRLMLFLARPAYDLTLEKTALDRYVNLTNTQLNSLTKILLAAFPLIFIIIGIIIGRMYRANYQD